MLKAVRRISAVLATTMVLLAVGPAAQAAVELNAEIVRDVTANIEQTPQADSVLPADLPSVPGVPSNPSGDTIPPETTILTGPAAFTNNATPTFTFSSDEPGSTFECSRNTAQPYVACTSPYIVTPAYTDGSKVFRVRATDVALNVDPSPATWSFLLDQVAPTASFTSGPASVTNLDPVAHSFTQSDASSGVDTIECSYDAEPFVVCASPVSRSLPEGGHSLSVRVTDGAGNPRTISHSFTVDRTAPIVAITSGPSAVTSSTAAAFTFTASDAHSTTAVCVLDETYTDPACTSPAGYSGPLADGTHTFDLTVTDAAGNATSLRRTWTVDSALPVATITVGPVEGSNSASNAASFEFVADESSVTFECSLDGVVFSSCASPSGLSGLSDDVHEFRVRAIDAAGNVGPAAQRSWRVDTTAPTVGITSGPADPSSNASPTFAFSGADGGSGIAGYECRLNAASFAACVTGDSVALSAQGPQTFDVRSIDAAGNVSAPSTHSWTFDSVAPQTTILTGPPAYTNVATQTFTFSSDDPGSTFVCSRQTGQPFVACVSPYTPVAYADGTRVFRVVATDAAGNVDASPASWSFVLDRVLPTASFTSIPANPTNADPVSHAFTRADASSGIDTVTCAFDGEAPTACVSPISRSLLDGSHTLVIRVTDRAGNLRTISNTFVVDLTAPTTTIVSGPAALTSSTSATFTFTATDGSGSGVASSACRVDGGSFASCTSGDTFGPFSDGAHTFDVRATDVAGNVGPSASHAWTVDATVPVATITSGPSGGFVTSASASFDFVSDESPSTFECSVDAASFSSCTSPAALSGLTDGAHSFDVRATDAAGNAGPAATRSWSVDTTAPTAAITAGPADPSSNSSSSFSFSGSDAGSGLAGFECSLNSGLFAACVTGDSFALSAQGPQTFDVRSIDAAGNVSAPATHSWTYDSITPETTILTGPPASTNIATPTFTFESDEPASTFECSRNTGQPYVACSSPYTPSPYVDGAKVFRVRATDAAGNIDPTPASWSFLMDRVTPTASFTSIPANPTNADPVSHDFSTSDASSGVSTVECSYDAEPFAACVSPISRSLLDGSHALVVRVTDRAGNVATISDEFTVDLTAPAVAITSGPSGFTASTSATFTFTSSDVHATTAVCVLDSTYTDPACTSPALYSGPLADGVHTFDLTVTDAAGNATSIRRTWTVDATPPLTTISSSPPTYTNATAAMVEFSATDGGSGVATYACDVDGAGFAPCVSPLSQVALSDGVHTVAVRATDNAGNTETAVSVSWTVDTAMPVTALTAKPKHFCCEPGTEATFEWTTDGTGSPVTGNECSVDGAGFTACSSPHVVTGVTEGVHEFQIRGLDAAGNVEAPVVYTWTQGDHPDTMIDSGPATPTSSTTVAFTFSSDRTPVTFRCLLQKNGGPLAYFQTCMTPKSYTGLGDGSYTFTVRALDALNNPDPEPATYDFVVDLTAPVVTVAPATSPTASSTVSFTFEANDPDATFECAMDGNLYGACSSPYAATGLTEGPHTFSVRAADALGNTSAPVSASVMVDTTGPSATIATGPASTTSSASATFTFSADDGSGTGVAELQCSLDAGVFATCTSPTTVTGLTDGAHTFAVQAVDAVGNVGPSVSHAWTVDGLAPTVTITSPTPGVYAGNSQIATSSGVYSFGDIVVTASVADLGGVSSVVFTLNETAVSHTCAAGSCSANITSTGSGTVGTVTVTAVDAAGNTQTATLLINFMS